MHDMHSLSIGMITFEQKNDIPLSLWHGVQYAPKPQQVQYAYAQAPPQVHYFSLNVYVCMSVSRPPACLSHAVSSPVNLLRTRPLTYRYDCTRLNMHSSRRSSSTHMPSKRNSLTFSPR